MPTLPLYLPSPAHPDASHRVAAPGGYEWWHFDGGGGTGDVRFVVALYDGCPFHPDYLRRYASYLRAPTRNTPPVPRDYPRVEFALFESGRALADVVADLAAGSVTADTCRPDVRAGSHRFQRRDDGSLYLRLEDEAVRADVVFRPLLPHRPYEQVLLSHPAASIEHRRILSDPLCSVEGSISLANGARVVPITGRGYHDHHYGTAPPLTTWRSWIRGRAIIGDAVYAFDHARPRSRGLRQFTRMVVADAAGVREEPEGRLTFHQSAATIRFGDELVLSSPRRLGTTARGSRIAYDAATRDGRTGTALCEVTR